MSNIKLAVVSALSALTLAACSDNDNNGGASSSLIETSSSVAVSSEASSSVAVSSESSSSEAAVEMATYKVAIVNATAAQILAPAVVFLADQSMPFWTIGSPSSEALENLAESGSPAEMVAAYPDTYSTTTGGMTMPGAASEVTIMIEAGKAAMLTLASMPVFTNDAFVGVQNVDVSGLAIGDSMSIYANIYDAGTEKNTESMQTVPGPGIDGEGFNAVRDDIADQVTMHPGVVSQYGLGTSALHEGYRFDSNSFIVKVYRTANP